MLGSQGCPPSMSMPYKMQSVDKRNILMWISRRSNRYRSFERMGGKAYPVSRSGN